MKQRRNRLGLLGVSFCILIASLHDGRVRAEQSALPQERLGTGRLFPIKWSAGCGIDSLYMGLQLLGHPVDYFDLIDKAGIEKPEQWVSLGTLQRVAREVNAYALSVKIGGNRETELRRRLQERPPRTALVHLQAASGQPEHLACVYLDKRNRIRVAGGQTYQPDVARTWRQRWSGAALLLSRQPFHEDIRGGRPAPRIQVDQTVLDAGEVPNGGRHEFSFAIRNVGNDTLRVDRVIPSCSCSTPDLADSAIVPAGSTTLKLTVNIGKDQGPGQGKVSILSNDPEKPCLDVLLRWRVGPPLMELYPATVMITGIEPGGQGDATVAIHLREGVPVTLADINVATDCPWIRCVLQPKEETLSVVVSPTCSSGKQFGRVLLSTKSPDARLVLPVQVEVRPVIIVSPAKVFCTRERDAEPVTRSVALRPAGDKDGFEVLGAELEGVAGRVEVHRDPHGSSVWSLHVELAPRAQDSPRFLMGQIIVRTSHARVREIRIPVFVN